MSSYWHPALPNAAIARGVLKQYPATLKILLRPNHNWSQLKSEISLATGCSSVCDPFVAAQHRIQALFPCPVNAPPAKAGGFRLRLKAGLVRPLADSDGGYASNCLENHRPALALSGS